MLPVSLSRCSNTLNFRRHQLGGTGFVTPARPRKKEFWHPICPWNGGTATPAVVLRHPARPSPLALRHMRFLRPLSTSSMDAAKSQSCRLEAGLYGTVMVENRNLSTSSEAERSSSPMRSRTLARSGKVATSSSGRVRSTLVGASTRLKQ